MASTATRTLTRIVQNAGVPVCRRSSSRTRRSAPRALLLYAGAEHTKEGIKIHLHDQTTAILNLAKHLGMFVTKHEVKTDQLPIKVVGIEIVMSPDVDEEPLDGGAIPA